jgi:hypothetical protein
MVRFVILTLYVSLFIFMFFLDKWVQKENPIQNLNTF